MTHNEFDILEKLESISQGGAEECILEQFHMPLDVLTSTMRLLNEKGYILEGKITEAGRNALEPYRVKRAILIAAGFGVRLLPITINTPKPLVRVNEIRMIDTLLDAILEAGIREIYIVRGHLGEQFDQLLYKYPDIKFLENKEYLDANNISSVLTAAELLPGSYLLEADLLLYNKKLIKKYQFSSNYLGVPVHETEDWCFHTKGDKIVNLSVGGTDCYHMFGISFWSEEDGRKLRGHIKNIYNSPGGKDKYWDQVALQYYINDYEISVRKCTFEDIAEIDTFSELKALDKRYETQ